MPTPPAEVIIFPDKKRLAREEKAARLRAVEEARTKKVAADRARWNRARPDVKITLWDADGNEVK